MPAILLNSMVVRHFSHTSNILHETCCYSVNDVMTTKVESHGFIYVPFL